CVAFEAELIGEFFDSDALSEGHLAGRPLEVEDFPGDGSGLLSRVATRRRGLRLLLLVGLLGHHDVGSEVVSDDLGAGEGTFGEKLGVDFDLASFLDALTGWFLFFPPFFADLVGGFLATYRRGPRHRRRR